MRKKITLSSESMHTVCEKMDSAHIPLFCFMDNNLFHINDKFTVQSK